MITQGAGCGLQGLGCLLLFPGLFFLLLTVAILRSPQGSEDASIPGLVALILLIGALWLLRIGRRALTAPQRIEILFGDEK